jgi:rhamnose transport system ATP-binding protein
LSKPANLLIPLSQGAAHIVKGLCQPADFVSRYFLTDFTRKVEPCPITNRRTNLPANQISTAQSRPILELTNIVKSFGGVRALRGVSFTLRPGEVHAIVGENGAGKSTLIKTIAGAIAPDSGTITIDGKIIEENSPSLARSLGVAVVYQQPSLFADLTVAENIGLRIEPPSPWRRVRWGDRRKQTIALLDEVGAKISPDAYVRDLSMPQQQLLEIATAIGGNVRVLILDEPTASLGDQETENLIKVIQRLRARGVGLIYISHRLEELPRVADRVTVLRDGTYIDTREMAGIDRRELIRLMVGRDLSAVYPKEHAEPGEVLLETCGIGCRFSGVNDVNLTVRAGEIVGLAGLVGAGRTELARVLFGITPADLGDIVLAGKKVRIDSPAQAIEQGLAYVPEDRRRHGVVQDLPVSANISLAVLRRIANSGLIDFAEERELADSFVQRLGIKTASVASLAGTLSGGNQQKVAVARWLATEPKVIILDEPTQGVDVGAKSEIYRLMSDLAQKGLAILMISSDLPEVFGMADRIIVMHGGRVVGEMDRAAATPERVLELALGHAVSLPAKGVA